MNPMPIPRQPSTIDGAVRVFLVDPHEVFRIGVKTVLSTIDEPMKVVGEAATVAQARARIPAAKPDVVILCVELPDGSGITLCRDLLDKMHALVFLMLTSVTTDEAMLAAFLAGAAGYVVKDVAPADLVAAIRTVASGRSLLDPQAMAAVLRKLREPVAAPGLVTLLTEQERVCLDLIGEGMTNRQIAETMVVAEKTVKNYVSAILGKLSMTSRTQAAIFITTKHADADAGRF